MSFWNDPDPDDDNDWDDDGLAEDLKTWPNCATPDCENKTYCWAGVDVCHWCATQRLGKAEMDRRYASTHDSERCWTGAIAGPLP